MKTKDTATRNVLAEFDNPSDLLKAATIIRDAGYKKFDCFSPFPIHGMDEAMGLKRSPLGYVVFLVAMMALLAGFGLEWWTSTIAYPLVISGKPFFSYQAYGPVAFAVMVLASSFTALLGMLALNKLPRFHHPLFNSGRFERVMNDGFFIAIEPDEINYNIAEIKKILGKSGGKNVEVIKEV